MAGYIENSVDVCVWLTLPLKIYDSLFDQHGHAARVKFRNLLSEQIEKFSSKVPILNETALESIPDGHLVCVEGMVQDMFNMELFMDDCVLATSMGDVRRSFRFRDYTDEIDSLEDPKDVRFSERQTFYIVPVPGESQWVRAARAKRCSYVPGDGLTGLKRVSHEHDAPTNCKKAKTSDDDPPVSKPKAGKQFPLSEEEDDEMKTGVIVRVYEDIQDSLKLNEVVQVYGILEHTRMGSVMTPDEFTSNCKGAEPIPRVHAVVVRRMQHNNPYLLETSALNGCVLPASADWSPEDVCQLQSCRSTIRTALTECLKGDLLAAEYTLLHLVSTCALSDAPYPTALPPLNIISWISQQCEERPGSEVSLLLTHLRSLLPCLVTQLAPIELTLAALNNGPNLMPIRDPSKGSLDSGRLQLPQGTEVLVNETGMTTGQLEARGVLNMRALSRMAAERRVPYDFHFFTQDYETDCRILILSVGHSLIKPVLSVPWTPQQSFVLSEFTYDQSDPKWIKPRNFITTVSRSNNRYSIDDALQQKINDDFVTWRREKETFIAAEDLAVMLCLLKLLCLTNGETCATQERWEEVCELENQRRSRLKQMQSNPQC